MSTNQPTQAVEAGNGGAPDARQLRKVLTAVSIALMAVIASVTGLNVPADPGTFPQDTGILTINCSLAPHAR